MGEVVELTALLSCWPAAVEGERQDVFSMYCFNQERSTWSEICIMLAVLFAWWKSSIPGDVEHRDFNVGLECNSTSVLRTSHPVLEQNSTRMEGFHHSC